MRHHQGMLLLTLLALTLSCRPNSPQDDRSATSAETIKPAESTPEAVRRATDPGVESAALGLPLGSLPPEVRQSLEKIRVLRLTDDTIDLAWGLRDSNQSYGVIVLDCSPEVLSTSRVKAIVDWAKMGKGLFIQGRHVALFSHQLLPSPYYLGYSSMTLGQPRLVLKGGLSRDVLRVANYLWCPARAASLQFYRQVDEERKDLPDLPEPRTLLSEKNGALIPVLIDSSNAEAYFLLSSTYQRARVVWYSGDVNFSTKKCQPQYDDVRLWSNLMHWLAGEDSGTKEP